jgi:di/tricarboxylate transporter
LQSQSKALTDKGVISYFAEGVSAQLVASGMAPVGIWMLLLIVYVAMHYLFASQSAHVAAMYPPFLAGEQGVLVHTPCCTLYSPCLTRRTYLLSDCLT